MNRAVLALWLVVTSVSLAGCGNLLGANCDPAYPTVCIPSPPPDLDCEDITHRNFPVNPPDPHGFDQDGDGIGCET